MMKSSNFGFTVIELLVAITIIGILSAIIFSGFGETRAQARDGVRQTDLRELALALEQYRADWGRYPFMCEELSNGWSTESSCAGGEYIVGATLDGFDYPGLIPDYISRLPRDPNNESPGYQYRTDGNSYKVITENVESLVVASFEHQFVRCPEGVDCAGQGPLNFDGDSTSSVYAVFSRGAEEG